MSKWDKSDWARFLIGLSYVCFFFGLIMIGLGIFTIQNQNTLYDLIVGVSEVLVGLFLVGVGINYSRGHP